MVPRSGQVPLTVRIGAVSVVVTPATASLGVGAVLQLAAAVRAADGQALDVEPQWATTNPAVAVVDAGGLVTAVAGGEVEVVATVAGVAGTSRVTVVAPRWNGVHAVGTAGADWATDLALGPGGTVTICGYTYGAMAGSVSAGDRDAFVARFDAEGALLWVRQWGSPGSDTAFSVAVDDRGNAYVAGDGPSGAAGALQKFDPAGTLEWAASVPGWSNFLATAVVRGGDVYLSGIRYGTESFVARFSPDGTQRALDVFEPAGLFRLAPGPEGGWYLGGAPGAGRLRVERRDAAMNRVWSTELLVPGDSWISALVPRSDGVWLAFWTDDSWHGAPDPAEPWEYNSFVAWLGVAAGRLGDTSWLGVGFVEDLAVDSRGDLRVTGAAQRAGFAGSTDASGSVVAKLAQDGTVVWSADAPAGTGAYTSALALDPLDDAFVSGTGWATAVGNADAMIFRVDAAGTLR
jgi:hypothetical protein